jgi:hypothetical protein
VVRTVRNTPVVVWRYLNAVLGEVKERPAAKAEANLL